MRYGRYGTSHWLLRLGLGLTFLWIGIDIFRHTDAWIGFVPENLPFGLKRAVSLQLTGLLDIGLGLAILTNKFPRASAALAAGHLAAILISQGIDQVIIRDVGLFGTALALLFWPQHGYRKHWWRRVLPRRHPDSAEE